MESNYITTVPPAVNPGEMFYVNVGVDTFSIICPMNITPSNRQICFTLKNTFPKNIQKGEQFAFTLPEADIENNVVSLIDQHYITIMPPKNVGRGDLNPPISGELPDFNGSLVGPNHSMFASNHNEPVYPEFFPNYSGMTGLPRPRFDAYLPVVGPNRERVRLPDSIPDEFPFEFPY